MGSKYTLLNPSTHIGAAHRSVHRGNASRYLLILSVSRNKVNFLTVWKPQRFQDYVRMAYFSYQLPEFRKMKQNTRPRILSMHEMLLVVFKVGHQNGWSAMGFHLPEMEVPCGWL